MPCRGTRTKLELAMNRTLLKWFLAGALTYTAVTLIMNKGILQLYKSQTWSVVYGQF